jgi:hypothetical protein|tara:strand:- start:206 stop:1585 length:1380 start_codon:yes stop_codon:yes gene_type:complete
MATFKDMSRREWEKTVSGSSVSRRDVFVDAIKAGDPVSDIDGNDVIIANTKDNIDALDFYLQSEPGKRGKDFFILSKKDGGVIQSNKIGKSPLFGGAGTGGGATGKTAQAESLQCIYIAAMLGEGSRNEFSHFTYETLKGYSTNVSVDVSFDDYMSLDGDWHMSSYLIAKALIKAKYVTSRHTIHRGDALMESIYKEKDRVRKLEGKPRLDNDKWNPGDIWAVKSGTNPKIIFSKAKTLEELNVLIKKHFIDRSIVGISLKKVAANKRVKISEYNIEVKEQDKHTFTGITLDTAGKGVFSSKYGFFIFDRTKKAEVRSPNVFSALNMELKGVRAKGGRTGYGQLIYSAGVHLKKVLPPNTDLVTKAKILGGAKPPNMMVNDFFNLIKKIHPNTERVEFESQMKSKNAGFIHALYAAAHVGAALMAATKTQRDNFTSEIVSVMAAKTAESSAYVKAEEKG